MVAVAVEETLWSEFLRFGVALRLKSDFGWPYLQPTVVYA